MQTVLYISPMELGHEVPVREIHKRFPVAALDRGAGVERLAAFIGSGFYALELTVADTHSDGDFQLQLHRFLATPEVASFFQELSAHVEHVPTDVEETAAMPLAAPMLAWERGGAS